MRKIHQIQITLLGIKPRIWRRILVNPDILLDDFHRIVQIAMGWTNSHMHLFADGIYEYAPEEFDMEGTKDTRKVKLGSILKKEKSKIQYEYDFGDGWVHEILLEKILPPDEKMQIPKCIAGKRNCPPEDCGGIWGYEDLLEIISNPEHEEHDEMMEWVGDDFDPAFFSKDEINKLLMWK